MQCPNHFPDGCEFFSVSGEIKNFVRLTDRQLYLLSLDGAELIPVQVEPKEEKFPISAQSFLLVARRCQSFFARLAHNRLGA